ncbi:MAG: CpaD family pilus assembly protein [Beijerinckiaceae bacterium]
MTAVNTQKYRFSSHAVSRLAAVLLAAGGLAACNSNSDVTSSIPQDYRQRHPIALVQGNQTLDVFTGRASRTLDPRQQDDVRAFGRDYMQNGQGPLIAYLPSGGAQGVNEGLSGIRQALAGGGASGRLQIAHYQPESGSGAPIRLAYAKLTAEVASRCGYDGEDIVPSRFTENTSNRANNNFGCTYQRNLAAQIADPRDLVRPRQEGPVDVKKLLAGIEKIRKVEAKNELRPDGVTIKETIGK